MPDISKITLDSGTTYDIKDQVARDAIDQLNSFEYYICTEASNTPSGISWTKEGVTVIGTLVAAEATKYKIYLVPRTNGENNFFDEFLTVNPSSGVYSWELIGSTSADIGDLGELAYKDTASASYTPSGSVSAPTISVNTAGATTTVNSITDVGTLPALTTTVSNETLSISFSQGTLPTKGDNTTVKTGDATYTASRPSFTGTAATITVS